MFAPPRRVRYFRECASTIAHVCEEKKGFGPEQRVRAKNRKVFSGERIVENRMLITTVVFRSEMRDCS